MRKVPGAIQTHCLHPMHESSSCARRRDSFARHGDTACMRMRVQGSRRSGHADKVTRAAAGGLGKFAYHKDASCLVSVRRPALRSAHQPLAQGLTCDARGAQVRWASYHRCGVPPDCTKRLGGASFHSSWAPVNESSSSANACSSCTLYAARVSGSLSTAYACKTNAQRLLCQLARSAALQRQHGCH